MSDDEERPGLQLISTGPGEAAEPSSLEQDGANDEAVRIRLAHLEDEHHDLDQAILSMEERMPYDQLTIQRLKKRKLSLKDEITKLRANVTPDIIA